VFVVDFDKLHFRELFEVFHERTRDVIERAVRLTFARQVNVRYTIGKSQFAVAGETIEHQCESLIAFDIAGTFEEFIEDGAQ
jgi:hypothetical protein